MKFNFRKISAIATSVLMTGMTMAGAAAASYPAPFVSGSTADVAIVYGANAAQTDLTAATNIQTNLASKIKTSTTVSTEGGVTENEVVLGGDAMIGKLAIATTALTDSKLPGLFDGKLTWDDGTGSEDYDVHEEIVISSAMDVITTLNDNDLDENVALTNAKAITYKYVFDEVINTSLVGDSDADDLFLSILGQEYEITNMDTSSITVVTSKEVALGIGGSYTDSSSGVTIIVDDVFEGSAQINGEMVSTGNTKTINGIKVKVDSVGYHSNSPETSKVILRIGEEISQQFTSGEEYIGEDEDDPNWVWEISRLGSVNGYIGVKYDQNQNDANDDLVYIGGSYVLPEDFASVSLVGLTDVDYEDVTLSFDENADLFNSTANEEAQSSEYVLMIEGENDDTISYGSYETDTLYMWYAKNGTSTEDTTGAFGAVELFIRDVNNDIADGAIRNRFVGKVNLTSLGGSSEANVANITVGDSVVALNIQAVNGNLNVEFEDSNAGTVTANVSGVAMANSTGAFKWLGTTTEGTSKEDAESLDLSIGSNSVGTETNDIMTYYGIIVEEPESNCNSDTVKLMIPSDQVYAEVAVAGAEGISTSTTGALGNVIVMDSEVSSVASKNLVIVGGSCINSAAANVLTGGAAACGDAFTAATGVGVGEWVIKSVADAYTSGKVALVVAGYEAADTTAAATYLTTKVDDTSVSYEGTSATEGSVMVA